MKDSDFKLALVRYVYDNLGYKVTEDRDAFSDIADQFRGNQRHSHSGEQTRWFDPGMRAFVRNSDSRISESKFRELDGNIRDYLSSLNKNRESPLELRYYQYLAVLFTEFVMDQHDRGILVDRFNDFIDDEFWQLEENVLHLPEFSKLAYWMATGSGKTHIMHINILQAVEYFDEDEFDNLILIAPNEGIAEQHMNEFSENGISYESIDDDGDSFNRVKVTDINKLKRGESGPKTVDVEEFGQQNIIFVDEGHKGLGSLSGGSSSGWVEKRDYLIGSDRTDGSIQRSGFAFEYSATFASSLSNAKGYQEYSRSIIVDYPYGRFHEDGYGKDYNILNISPDSNHADVIENEQRWLMSNILSYYEKLRIFEDEKDIVDENNVERPLSVFVGNSVNAINRGSSDVQTIVEFLSQVIQNEDGWATSVIESMLSKDAEFGDGDIFDDRFKYIRRHNNSAEELYEDLLEVLFDSRNPSNLEVIRLKNLDDEEVALSTDTTESYFGVVTVGDTKDFYDLIQDSENEIETTENEVHSTSLFDRIDSDGSSVDILIGSKKFAEGWDSTRPSVLGLLNLGRSEGSLVVQMFGRGVRVNGKDENGTRASTKNVQESKKFQISRLETLDVFGVRADYIETFKEHLEKERTEINDVKTVSVEVDKPQPSSDLKLPKFEKDTAEDEIPVVALGDTVGTEIINDLLNISEEDDKDYRVAPPSMDIQTKGSRITAEGEREYESKRNSYDIEDFKLDVHDLDLYLKSKGRKLKLLDWDNIWNSTIRYKNDRGYDEIVIEKSAVREFFEKEDYDLYLPSDALRLDSLSDLNRIESICVGLLSEYLDNLYSEMKRSVEYEEVKLNELNDEWIEDNIPNSYDVQIKNPSENEKILEELNSINEEDLEDLSSEKSGLTKKLFKYLDQLYIPVLLDTDAFDNKGTEKKYKEVIDSISPEGIDNMGEKKFVDALEHHITDGMLEEYKINIMRNQANKGVRIPMLSGNFYPDFVIWVTKDDRQHIILADPHGMVQGGEKSDLNAISKVNDKKSEEDEVETHACLFARTKNNGGSFYEAKQTVAESNSMEMSELRENHVYFVDEIADGIGKTEEQVGYMIEDFLGT